MLIYFVKQALWLTVMMSAPVVLLTMVIGLTLGFLQAIFQLQDQSFPFAFKLIGSLLILIALGPWMAESMMEFSRMLIDQFASM